MAAHSNTKTIYDILGREPVHPFPARMAPGIALDALKSGGAGIRVLDPMMGSGTVLAVARSQGHRAIGYDIDPLAVLISSVWTTPVDPGELRDKANEVLDRARRRFLRMTAGEAYPQSADDETRAFVRYWFDPYARRQLASLADVIVRVRNLTLQNALWCAFSRLIITKQAGASRAMDLSHSRPHRVFEYAPVKPFRKFLSAASTVADNCIGSQQSPRGPTARAEAGDARSLPIEDESIDVVLTSPPYLNAIDYMRCSKFSLVWMGHTIRSLRDLRARSVGTEVGRGALLDDPNVRAILSDLRLRPKLEQRDEAVLATYIGDLRLTIREVARVLAKGGRAVYVVGENTVRGTFIRNSSVVSAIGQNEGLKLSNQRFRRLPPNRRYLPPPTTRDRVAAREQLDGRMRREAILTFEKPS